MTLTVHYTDGPSNTPRTPGTISKLTHVVMNSDKSLEYMGEVNISDDIDNPQIFEFTGKIPASEIECYFITNSYPSKG